ncbi:hypothetical protein B296_00025160 [Ensete ventricosum]|uniref:Uncharacterized protein n=1 Tax=Ensete ventricosum TaxID=4639 RepID=A0A427ATT3_ENSVE|nr:hypothetical protein B296_00025160 [Ensete ventricosum]
MHDGGRVLQSAVAKAIANYKRSHGFQSRLEKIGQVTYEFGYWVVQKHFWAKYPNLSLEEDPFADQPKDANVQMETSQPFDDSTPPED